MFSQGWVRIIFVSWMGPINMIDTNHIKRWARIMGWIEIIKIDFIDFKGGHEVSKLISDYIYFRVTGMSTNLFQK